MGFDNGLAHISLKQVNGYLPGLSTLNFGMLA